MSRPKSDVKSHLSSHDGVDEVCEVTGGLLVEIKQISHHTSTFIKLLGEYNWYVETVHWNDKVIRVVPCDEVTY